MRSPPSKAAALCSRTRTPLRPAPPRCPPDPHPGGFRGPGVIVPGPCPRSTSHSQCCPAVCSYPCVAAERQARVRGSRPRTQRCHHAVTAGPAAQACVPCAAQPMSGLKAEGDLFEMIKLEVQRDANVRKRRASGDSLAPRLAACS